MLTVSFGLRTGLIAALTMGALTGAALGQQPSATGLWLDNEGRAGIEIARCDKSMCGKIVWLKEPIDPQGKPWTDINNMDASKRSTPVCGMQVIGELKRETNGDWSGGWVYDPEVGKRFTIEIALKDANTLSVFAFDGDRARSETMNWTRMPDSTARCK